MGPYSMDLHGDGTQSRCFCHVSDTVAGIISLLDSPDVIGDVFNVGSQNEISMRALAELVVELTDSSSEITFVPYSVAYEPQFEDMERRLPDISKIARATGWAPTYALKDILLDVIAHERVSLAALAADPA